LEDALKQSIVHIALVVKDYDEAITFYTQKLDFELIEDTYIPEQDKRWVLISPKNDGGCALLLAKASNNDQELSVGNQAGGRVFLFLSTDDFWRDYSLYLKRGVKFVREPAEYDYGIVAVFEDLYGNRWDLLEHKTGHRFSQH
jgi:catechol 2,3-dioxygenase-like lactoylglutathione lyase family enzyme